MMDAITKRKVLELIENDARLTPKQIAVMIDKDEAEVTGIIKSCEEDGTIRGYKTLIDWDKTEKECVTAFIELKVSPQANRGFEKIADRISGYPEVRDLHLMSGAFDFLILIEGRTLREVAAVLASTLKKSSK